MVVVVVSIMVVGTLARCAFFSSICELKVTLMNVQHRLIRDLQPNKFELSYHSEWSTKTIFVATVKAKPVTVTITRWFKKFQSFIRTTVIKKSQVSLKAWSSEAVFQVIEAKLIRSTRRVSGELGISQTSVLRHLYDLGKSICSCWIVTPVNKILQNFNQTLYIYIHIYIYTWCIR